MRFFWFFVSKSLICSPVFFTTSISSFTQLMLTAGRPDKLFAINNKNYSNIFSGSDFITKKESASALIFQPNSALNVYVNLVIRDLKKCFSTMINLLEFR